MSATQDVARMLTLVPWVVARPGASLAEIAEAFGVDEATIRRDLGALDFCGLPGLGGGDLFDVTTVGDRVVIQMADELTRPLRPTPSEALRLVLTVDAMADVAGDEVPALRSAVAKIRAALGIPESTADVVDGEGPAPVHGLRQAIREARRVEISYRARGQDVARRRRLDPWALHVSDGTWYLQAHDEERDAPRTFRLDRIEAMTVLDEPVRVPTPDPLPAPRYAPAEGDLVVELALDAAGAWLREAVVVDDEAPGPDGGTRLRFRTDQPTWVVQLVLMAAGHARVVEPAWLVERVATAAREARAAYET